MNPLWDTLFARHAGSDAPLLISPKGEATSYAAFLDRAGRMAGALEAIGLAPGDRLAAQVPKCADAIVLYAACAARGVVLLPLNTAYTAAELDYFVRDAGAAALVCDPADAEALRPLAEGAGARLETLGPDGAGTLPKRADRAAPAAPAEREEGDLAAFLYTSGTTGRSKGAMLTQGNLLSNARTLAAHWRFTPQDVLLHALPIFHTHGLFVAINTVLASGAAMVLFPKLDPPAMIEAMPRATTMMGVPTFYTRLLAEPGLGAAAKDMRLFVSGSAPLLPETHAAWEKATGHRILERYGMTETNMNTSNPYDGERRAGTVGMPLPGVELRVCAPGTVDELPAGETGVIEVRGPNVFAGYWNMPEKTAAELRPDGWFVTGDLGRVDADGYVSIVGRDKDLIISGGYNVYPREVEEVLDAQPGVAESAVVGAPHPDFGEGVVAVIVPEGGGPDMDALQEAVAAVLANYKRPRRYATAEALPRNTMGKVQKAELRRIHAAAFEAGAA